MFDRYTKIMLTVIATCMVWNVFHDAITIRPASAQSGAVHVIVDAWGAYVATMPIAVRMER